MKYLHHKKISGLFLLITIFLITSLSPAFAGEELTLESLQKKLASLEKKVEQQQKEIQTYKELLDQQIRLNEKQRQEIQKTFQEATGLSSEKVGKILARKKPGPLTAHPYMPGNFKIGANFTGIVQGSPDARLIGEDRKSVMGASYQANVTIANKFEGVDGIAVANLRVSQGSGIEDQLSIYSNVDNNNWGNDVFTLSEIFYEQNLFNKNLVVDIGKLDPTVYFALNEYANSDTTQFLARMFNNSPVIEFPDHSGGVRIAVFPYKWLEISYMAMAGTADMRDLESRMFHIGQVIFKPSISGRKGNYRFLMWQNNNPHTVWKDLTRTREDSYGFSISCDQEINDDVGIFGKFGWQDPSVYNPDQRAYPFSDSDPNPHKNNYTLEYMWSTGLQVKGHPWGRAHDFFGVAIGQVIPSQDMKSALSGMPDNRREAKSETHFEIYYNFFANKYLAISPGVQLIWDPYGGDAGGEGMVSVYTLRTHFDF
ncbi:MAG: hypothetical protein GF409_08655 [Candidatus Omnitrophica bacterium]|nr:hypothetical protein [Candidatus Omnitrophota bacterium]